MNRRRLRHRVAVFVDRAWGYLALLAIFALIGVIAHGGGT